MNKIILISALFLTLSTPLYAQILPIDKNCIQVHNQTQHTITGDFVSDQYKKESEWGDTMVSHRHKFKIARNETQTICPAGPYFAGPSIEFVIRRAWPVFRCKAMLGHALNVTSIIDQDGGETFKANCF